MPDRQPVVIDLAAQTGNPANTFSMGHVTIEEGVVTARADVEPDAAFAPVPDVYRDLGIPAEAVSVLDPGGHRIVVVEYRTSRLAGSRLSKYLRCGDSIGRPKADNGQVRLTLRTWVEPYEEGAAAINTAVRAWTRGSGASTGRIQCASNGSLETEILRRIVLELARDAL